MRQPRGGRPAPWHVKVPESVPEVGQLLVPAIPALDVAYYALPRGRRFLGRGIFVRREPIGEVA
eukprot:648940-Pyramimonas_sp.AAC.2